MSRFRKKKNKKRSIFSIQKLAVVVLLFMFISGINRLATYPWQITPEAPATMLTATYIPTQTAFAITEVTETPVSTDTPTSTPTQTLTPTPTLSAASLDGSPPETSYLRRSDALYAFGLGEIAYEYQTQAVSQDVHGVLSAHLNINDERNKEDLSGGWVAGAWPFVTDEGDIRIVGECSHPCNVYIVDDAGTIIAAQEWGVINLKIRLLSGEYRIVVKPSPEFSRLSDITFRAGVFDEPVLIVPNPDEGVRFPKVGWMQTDDLGLGLAAAVFTKPVGFPVYFKLPIDSGSFDYMFTRDYLGALEQDDLTGQYIIPIRLPVGTYDIQITCLHICDIEFPREGDGWIRSPLHMEWTPENEGKLDTSIVVPQDAGTAVGWIIVRQTHFGGPDIGLIILID